MATFFETMFEACAQPVMKAVHGVSVTLTRGLDTSGAFTATMSERAYDLVDSSGNYTEVTGYEWVISTADYATTSALSPAAGDVITYGGKKYEVMPIAGRPAADAQNSDQSWLVRTKRIKT